MERRLREKQAIEAIFNGLLEDFEHGALPFGDWEANCMRHGLGSLLRGQHALAVVEADDVLTAPSERARVPSEEVTVRELRRALRYIQGSPPLAYPVFG
jgi:hypothetical protein